MRYSRCLLIGMALALLGGCSGEETSDTAVATTVPATATTATTAAPDTTATTATTAAPATTTTMIPPTTVPVLYEGPSPIIWAVSADDAAVFRIDTESGEVMTIGLGDRPHRILYAEGAVWVSDCVAGAVFRIEPYAPFMFQRIDAGGCPYGMTARDGYVLVTNALAEGTLTVLRAGDGAVLGRVPVGDSPTGVTLVERPLISSWRQTPALMGLYAVISRSHQGITVVSWPELIDALQIAPAPSTGCSAPFASGADDDTQRNAVQAAYDERKAALDDLKAARARVVAAAGQVANAFNLANKAAEDGDMTAAGQHANEAAQAEAAALAAWHDAETAYDHFMQAQCRYDTALRAYAETHGGATNAPNANDAVSREAEEAYRRAYAAAQDADWYEAHARAAGEGTVGPWSKDFDPTPGAGVTADQYPGPDGAEGAVTWGSQALIYSGTGEVWNFDPVSGTTTNRSSSAEPLVHGASDGYQALFTDAAFTAWYYDGTRLQEFADVAGLAATELFYGDGYGGTTSGEIVSLPDGQAVAAPGSPITDMSAQLPLHSAFDPVTCPGADPALEAIDASRASVEERRPGLGTVCPDGTLASSLGLADLTQPYHPLYNQLIYKCGCP